MIKNLGKFFQDSYRSDPLAFYFEMTGSVAAIVASGWLSITADSPPLIWIYPIYLTSSLLHTVAGVRRNAAWIALLSVYFSFVNVYGILNLTVF
jgi:hypothetical protein